MLIVERRESIRMFLKAPRITSKFEEVKPSDSFMMRAQIAGQDDFNKSNISGDRYQPERSIHDLADRLQKSSKKSFFGIISVSVLFAISR